MKRRCPHCQTTPLRDDAETCWYCGKDYVAQASHASRGTCCGARVAVAATAGGQDDGDHRKVSTAWSAGVVTGRAARPSEARQSSKCSLRGQREASTVAR